MTRTAVILAAGMGTRLRSVIGHKPKGLLPWGEKTLIEHSIEALAGAGVERLIVVVGFEAEQYYSALKRQPLAVEFVVNEDYAQTGSMHSLSLCQAKAEDDFLLLESDLLYERRALDLLLAAPERDLVLLSGPTGAGDEVYVFGRQGLLQAVSKTRLDLPLLGELVGISRIGRPLFESMCRLYASRTADPRYDYENCLADVGSAHPVRTLLVEDLAWVEIDGPEHLDRAERVIGPLLRRRDG